MKFDLHSAAPLHLQGNPCTGLGTACLLGTSVPIICRASENQCQEKQITHGIARMVISCLGGSWRIAMKGLKGLKGLPISLEQQRAATTLTDFVDATSGIGRPVWQALDYRLADHGGAQGDKKWTEKILTHRDPESECECF